MQVILTSYNNIKARQTTAAIESRTITTKAGNGVIIEKWLQRSRGRLRPWNTLKKASSVYGKFGWIELYFEIALYNSQYQIDSIKNGEYYE